MHYKELYIRVDMNEIIATGHIMRCMAVAKAARDNGISVVFITADDKAEEFIINEGFTNIVLYSDWSDLDKEIPLMLSLISEKKIGLLLVDTYAVTPDYLFQLSMYTSVYYMDDLNRFNYPVDGLICYAPYYKKFNYENEYGNDVELLLGLDYVPLRKEFAEIPPHQINKEISKLVLLSGGSDEYNALDLILESLSLSDYGMITVVCGRYNCNYEQLLAKYRLYKNINILRNITNMATLLQDADLVVSAGGTTLYEICACGTPAISYTLADNQLDNVKAFDDIGIIPYVGDVRYDDFSTLPYLIKNYSSFEKRQKISETMKKLVDGKGAYRIIKTICNI